jgi:hypothetical protein
VKKHLKQMCGLIEEQMMNKADEVFVLMRRDYLTVITGAHVPQGQMMPKWERTMKAEIKKLIQEKEDAAEKEENPDTRDSQMEVDEAADQDRSSTPIKPDPEVEGEVEVETDQNESDTDAPAKDIADSIQEALNQEIEEEYREPKVEEDDSD